MKFPENTSEQCIDLFIDIHGVEDPETICQMEYSSLIVSGAFIQESYERIESLAGCVGQEPVFLFRSHG